MHGMELMPVIRVILAGLLVLGTVAPSQLNANAQPQKGAYLDEITFIRYLDENVATQEVKAGNIDAYYWRLPLEIVPTLKNDPNVIVYETYGDSLALLLNPATGGEFNPFSLKDVRYAVNYLIDRDLVVNEILKGFGSPMFSAFGQFDPDYLVLIDILESLGLKYNPKLAEKTITTAMEKAGAVKKDNKWTYKEKPVTIKFFIRNDDPRRNAIGEALSTEFEKAGFTVIKDVGDLNKALTVVYSSDPKEMKWSIYTEGYGRSAFEKYDSTLTAQMYAPWFANMPGFMSPGYWNYKNAKLDELTMRIFNGNYTSKSERDVILRSAVDLGVKESVRIFVANTFHPYLTTKDVHGMINDFGAGITTRFGLINARIDDSDSMKIGMKQIYQGAWNPVGGFGDWYATRIWMGITDLPSFRHPHTGEVIPIRASWDVDTRGPLGKLDVPADAFLWDAYADKWVTVGKGTKATSKVVFDLRYSNWHDGTSMDRNDILHSIYFASEWGTKEGEDDPTFDSEYTAQAGPLVKTMKGFRFIDDNTVEVYVDYWHFDEDYIADYATVWASMPWEIYAAMEKVVTDGKAAFSRASATSKDVEWLSLIVTSNTNLMEDALKELKTSAVIPKALQGKVDAGYAAKRYDASIKWIEDNGHALISNGPFYLKSYNPEAGTITIKAFRDSSYPFETGHWNGFETIRAAAIKNVDVPLSIELGTPAKIAGKAITQGGSGTDIQLHYFMKDSKGKTVVSGTVQPSADGNFAINLSGGDTAKLSAGPNEIKLFAISTYALRPDIYATSIIGMPSKKMPAGDTEPAKQLDISFAVKQKKKMAVIAVKNNDAEPIFGIKLKIDGIKLVKAKGWEREKIDKSTVMLTTLEKPIGTGKTLLITVRADGTSYEWAAFDKAGTQIASGRVTK